MGTSAVDRDPKTDSRVPRYPRGTAVTMLTLLAPAGALSTSRMPSGSTAKVPAAAVRNVSRGVRSSFDSSTRVFSVQRAVRLCKRGSTDDCA